MTGEADEDEDGTLLPGLPPALFQRAQKDFLQSPANWGVTNVTPGVASGLTYSTNNSSTASAANYVSASSLLEK